MIQNNGFIRRFRTHAGELTALCRRVMRSGWYILGPEVEGFEKAFASFLGAKYVIGVNSGTDAIVLGLKALGIGRGDEVMTVANTATPTVVAIRMVGARVRFVDIDPQTYTLDPKKIESKITSRTKALLPVHLFGYPADMTKIVAIAKKYSLYVLEDSAQATGTIYKNKYAGTMGDIAAFSFYPTKNLGAFGDAGAVVTNNALFAQKVRKMRNYGESAKYVNTIDGVNSRMDELQAALLSWGLGHLSRWNIRRRRIAKMYTNQLRGLPLILPPAGDSKHRPSWHLYVIRTSRRDELRDYLQKNGVQVAIHYPKPIFEQPAYRELKSQSKYLPYTTRVMQEILSLPMYPELTDSEVGRVCSFIRNYLSKHSHCLVQPN